MIVKQENYTGDLIYEGEDSDDDGRQEEEWIYKKIKSENKNTKFLYLYGEEISSVEVK